MVITRFAPSPTGYLHIGGLRTALYSYLWAKKNNGKFLLRIEDTDLKRNSKKAAKAIEEAFKWVGYELRESQMKLKKRPKYDGRYRDFKGTPPEGISPVVRIKSPINENITFKDGIKGTISVNTNDVMDDFIIARSDGTPTYNFVVTIDDHEMGVTDIIRGDDHLSNTPKQIIVYNALGWDLPKFYHVPMILNPQGKKLSKRDGAMDVMEYKKEGYLPEALLNFLVRLGWSHGDQEILNKSASAYNGEKLLWLNSHFIKESSYERIIKELKYFDVNLENIEKKEILIDALKERAKTLKEFAEKARLILEQPSEYDKKAVKKFIKADSKKISENFLDFLKNYNESLKIPTDYNEMIGKFLHKFDLKLKNIAQIIRISIVGSAVSPSIYDIMCIIGKDEVTKRVEKLIQFMEDNNE